MTIQNKGWGGGGGGRKKIYNDHLEQGRKIRRLTMTNQNRVKNKNSKTCNDLLEQGVGGGGGGGGDNKTYILQ